MDKPVQLIEVFLQEMCSLMVEEIAVSLQTRPLQYAQSLYKRQHYHNIVHYRCSRVETPQHRVLEYTINMGFYFTWIKLI